MRLNQSELDTLSVYSSQLIEMRDNLRTFDLQPDLVQNSRGNYTPLQDDFRRFHNQLCAMSVAMQKLVEAGA
jgi:hypothetical protein